MGSHIATPDYGRRLLPVLIDEIATENPDRAAFSIPRTDADLFQGYVDITYATFANAINQLAWLIESRLGRSERFDAIAYLGAPDMRYHCMQMAVAKTGYKVLFSSHSNSHEGHLALMAECNTTILVSASGVAVDDLLASRPMKHLLVPEFDDLLAATPVKHFPYNKTFEEAQDNPYLILHTSGTTGFPKAVQFSHGAIACMDAHRNLPDVDEKSGRNRNFTFSHGGPKRILCPFLHFHGISSIAMMNAMVHGQTIYVNGFRHRILEQGDLFNVLDNARLDVGVFSPALIEDLASHPESLKYLKSMSEIHYGGASLNHAAGRYLAQHTNLYAIWGATETMKIVCLEIDAEDFDYCAFDLEPNGLEFRHVTEDIHEMIFHRTPKSYPNIVFFHREPDAVIYKPGDLWSPHPDPKKAANLWKFRGRTDDLISFQDGNNFHPAAWELKHSEHDMIRTACIAGAGHRQPVLILELNDPSLADTPDKESQIIDKLWDENVVPINEIAPKNGQIAKTHIVIATEEKPFERNVKGTVSRQATLRKYEIETEAVYQQSGDRTMDVRERFQRKENIHNHG